MLKTLLEYDREVFLFLNGLGSQGWDAFWLALSDKWIAIPLYAMLLWLSLKAFGIKKTLLLLVAVALLITASDQLANFFKYGVQRPRPCHEESLQGVLRLVKAGCGGKFGYYSAHASNTMAAALFFTVLLGHRYKILIPVLLLWAIAVAFSRIYLGVHYPLDVLSGGLAGAFLGWLFAKLYLLALKKLAYDL